MKKVFMTLAIAAMAIGSLTSCGSKAAREGSDEGEALKAKIENCTNPDSLKMYVEQAQEYASKLEAEGKGVEAEAYLNKIAPVVKEKDPSVASYFEELKTKAKEEVTEAKEKADSVASDVADKGAAAVDSVKNAGKNAVEATKKAGAAAVDGAKDKGAAAVEKGKEKVSDAAQKGADKVKDLLK